MSTSVPPTAYSSSKATSSVVEFPQSKEQGGKRKVTPNNPPKLVSKRLKRKVDWRILPWLCLIQMLSYLDRVNIGQAKLYGLEADMNLEPHEFSWALSGFFISKSITYCCVICILIDIICSILLSLVVYIYFASHIYCFG